MTWLRTRPTFPSGTPPPSSDTSPARARPPTPTGARQVDGVAATARRRLARRRVYRPAGARPQLGQRGGGSTVASQACCQRQGNEPLETRTHAPAPNVCHDPTRAGGGGGAVVGLCILVLWAVGLG